MRGVVLICSSDIIAEAFALAFKTLKQVPVRHARSVNDLGQMQKSSLLILAGAERSRTGAIEEYFLLRHLLIGPNRQKIGPIAFVGILPSLFSDPCQQIPDKELIRYFKIPFDLVSLVNFLTSERDPSDRLVTRMLLRMQVTDEDIANMAAGDTHQLAHFSSLVRSIERALFQDDRTAFSRTDDLMLKGAFFTNQVLAAKAMVEQLSERAEKNPFKDDCKRLIDEIQSCIEFFAVLSSYADERGSGAQFAPEEWQGLLDGLRAISAEKARERELTYKDRIIALCRRLQS